MVVEGHKLSEKEYGPKKIKAKRKVIRNLA
jgi:hypothetical protein